MAPIRKGDGTPLDIPGVQEVRSGDGRVFFEGDAIPDSVVANLDHFWPMDDGAGSTASDPVGERPLSLVGPSFEDGYLEFDGIDDRAEEDNNDNRFNDFNEFTWFGWIRPNIDADDAGGRMTIAASYETDGDNRSWTIYNRNEELTNNNNSLNLITSDDGAVVGGENADTSEDIITVGEWQSVAVSVTEEEYDGDPYTVEFFVNGNLEHTGSTETMPTYPADEDLWIGQVQLTDDRGWDGDMMDHGINVSEGLSESEIQALHDDTGPGD